MQESVGVFVLFRQVKSTTLKVSFIISCLFLSWGLFGQGVVKGTVTDQNNKPISFAVVLVKGTNNGAQADEEGKFKLKNVPEGEQTLIFRILGKNIGEQIVSVTKDKITEVTAAIDVKAVDLDELLVSIKREKQSYVEKASTSSTRLGLSALENPQIIQVIGQGIIQDRQIQTIPEATKSMVGVTPFFSGYYSSYSMRGFRSMAGNLAFNGIRGAAYQQEQAGFIYNIEKVESIKGPAGVLFSAGNPGGVINHVTKKPQEDSRYQFQYTFGSFNQHRVMADATGKLAGKENKKLLYRLVGGFENTGAYDPNLKRQNYMLAPQLQFNYDSGSYVAYELNYVTDQSTMAYVPGLPAYYDMNSGEYILDYYDQGEISQIDPNGHGTRNTHFHTFRWKHAFNDKLNWNFQINSMNSHTWQYDIGRWSPFGAQNDSVYRYSSYWNDKFYSHRGIGYFQLKTGKEKSKVKNNLVFGGEFGLSASDYEYAEFEYQYQSVSNPVYGWGVYDLDEARSLLDVASYQSGWKESLDQYAGYFQDVVSIGDKLKLMLAARYEYVDIYFEQPDLITDDIWWTDSLTAQPVLPRAGLVYQLDSTMSVYYGYNSGFMPNFGSASAGGPFDPERSRQHETGVKKYFMEGKLWTTLALYSIQKYNVLIPDPTDPSGIKRTTIDSVRSKGVEVSVQGNVLKDLNVMVNYAFNLTENGAGVGFSAVPVERFPLAPKHNANVWVKYSVSKGALSNLGIGAGANYISDRTTFHPDIILPAYTTVDAMISYKWKKTVAAVNLYNVLNEKYWTGATGPGSMWYGNPRTFRISLTYTM